MCESVCVCVCVCVCVRAHLGVPKHYILGLSSPHSLNLICNYE